MTKENCKNLVNLLPFAYIELNIQVIDKIFSFYSDVFVVLVLAVGMAYVGYVRD